MLAFSHQLTIKGRTHTAQVVHPVQGLPPHCPYFATVHPVVDPLEVVEVAALDAFVLVVVPLDAFVVSVVPELAAVVDDAAAVPVAPV